MATNYANIFRIDPSKNNQDFAGDSNTLAYFLTGRGNQGLPPLITGISGNNLVIKYSNNDLSYHNISDWNVGNPYILLPGIVFDGVQRIGAGQASSMRLYDLSENQIIDLSINELKDQIKLYIDTNGNHINIKTVTNNSIYKDMYLWSIIFNVLDNNGMPLIRREDIDISLNTNYNYTYFSNLDLQYFNINTMSDVSNGLLRLDDNEQRIGTLNFIKQN